MIFLQTYSNCSSKYGGKNSVASGESSIVIPSVVVVVVGGGGGDYCRWSGKNFP